MHRDTQWPSPTSFFRNDSSSRFAANALVHHCLSEAALTKGSPQLVYIALWGVVVAHISNSEQANFAFIG